MKERPILFSGEMVRAILDGRKTQTRRPVKPQPWASCIIEEGLEDESPFVYSALTGDGPGYEVDEIRTPCKCPLGQPGDRLWVRETWRMALQQGPDGSQRMVAIYRADGEIKMPWRPSIHMLRWASRITLEITRVWVERVQDITEDGAIREGMVPLDRSSPSEMFRDTWQSIYGTWDANPWVWAVEFRRVK